MTASVDPASVKLVVWDLDDTLWRGTLAEGDVAPNSTLFALIRRMNAHGVPSSICSKNDPGRALGALRDLGMDDAFVMPAIAWRPKGELLGALIANFQLRPQSVLFIDDNRLNLEEAIFHNPGIATFHYTPAREAELVSTLDAVIARNRFDGGKRFGDYQVLGAKHEARHAFGSNDAFLRNSGIKVSIVRDWRMHLARVQELVNRAHQLNYTKQRATPEAVLALLTDRFDSGVVGAADRFGDYGIVGFYALDRADRSLVQFVFSCRVLDMGIEHHVWRMLGYPDLRPVGEIATPLQREKIVDWIADVAPGAADPGPGASQGGVLMIGGCDLREAAHYLQAELDFAVDKHLNAGSVAGIAMHRDGVNFLFGGANFTAGQKAFVCESVPFVGAAHFELPDFGRYRTIVYSPLIDYVQAELVAVHDGDLRLSFGDFTRPDSGVAYVSETLIRSGVSRQAVDALWRQWRPAPPISGTAFIARLEAIFAPFAGALFVLGGTERAGPGASAALIARHKRMNAAIRTFAASRENTVFVDIDDVIADDNEFVDSIRHYQRVVYRRLASQLAGAIRGQDADTRH